MFYVYKKNLIMIFCVFLNSHLVYDYSMLALENVGKLGVVWLVRYVFNLVFFLGKAKTKCGEFD